MNKTKLLIFSFIMIMATNLALSHSFSHAVAADTDESRNKAVSTSTSGTCIDVSEEEYNKLSAEDKGRIDKVRCKPGFQCGAIPQDICDKVFTRKDEKVDSTNPLGGLQPIIEWIVGIGITVVVVGAVLIIVVSGLQIAASAGNSEAISSAKKNITSAFTGLALLISFSALLSFVGVFDTGITPPTTLLSDINLQDQSQILNAPINPIVQVLLNAITITSFLTGIISVVMIVVGGVRYIYQGTTGNVEGAKKTIQYAVGGLALSLMAYSIVNFVVNALIK